jgi:serine/threonine protein kinase
LTICGTPLYSSPELLKKRGYSYKVDIWAMGIMCYELLMGRTPFHAWKLEDLIAKINRGDYPVKVRDESLTAECALFLAQCLQSDEAQRIEADQLLEHPFLKLDR